MKYGFIIDNRKCIGCHACTTACKSEHQVAVGVNRTWVKQVEKGVFPNTRRVFSVLRCNHCTNAPCVEICPVEALFIRDDGIVDFDKDRCIGCKSCMQACPYDALYIDPENHTAAKCNYCAHRIDIGLEPACVNVCPEHAIISGDMDNPDSEISQLLGREEVTVRKAEKGTVPNLFYIDGDQASLVPSATEKSSQYFWSAQERGVGHYAKEAEKMAFSNPDVMETLAQSNGTHGAAKSVEVLMGKPHRVYDAPDKGILWGWEVSAYLVTKAISAGVILVGLIGWFASGMPIDESISWSHLITSFVFLIATGVLLVMDLDRPDRFLNVLFRPQSKSWLVKGGYAITLFGLGLTITAVAKWSGWTLVFQGAAMATGVVGLIVAIYTAYLFAQAKGRDFWQSPMLPVHMLTHSILAGAAFLALLNLSILGQAALWPVLRWTLVVALIISAAVLIFELTIDHPTDDARRTAESIVYGNYRNHFWVAVVSIGIILPVFILVLTSTPMMIVAASIMCLIGIIYSEHIWVEAPQKISLS